MNSRQLRMVVLAVVGLILLVDVAPVSGITSLDPGRVDDWEYTPGEDGSESLEDVAHIPADMVYSFMAGLPFDTVGGTGVAGLASPLAVYVASSGSMIGATYQSTASKGMAESAGPGGGDIGFATGGAKDINNFRDNIAEGYTPIPTDIPYEGLFYDYYFDTGQQEACEELFCPSYSQAVTEDPLDNETERYMTVGLNSNLDQDMFERKKLNLVLVLDISGSMSSSFDEYYYDRFGNEHQVEEPTGKSKMQVAAESLAALTEHLEDGDRLGVVLFNNDAAKAKPLRLTEDTDMAAIRDHMLEIRAGGGTNMEAGMQQATEMIREYEDADRTEYENRIVFLTDAMPNIGETDARGDNSLLSMMEENAGDGIYTTFVGIGLDFQTELVDAITAVRGANYFSVHSSEQFSERMDDDFEYMVTPLVFNLSLRLDSDTMDIAKVYGSTAAEESTGEIMKVNTLFPSRTEDGETKGGVVLLQLEGEGDEADLTASYETRAGEQHTTSRTVSFAGQEPEYFENSGVRKAVLLSRYADLMKNWMVFEHDRADALDPEAADAVATAREEGIEPPHPSYELGRWERQSIMLSVGDEYENRIERFRQYYQDEMDAIGDEDLEQEYELMGDILAAAQ